MNQFLPNFAVKSREAYHRMLRALPNPFCRDHELLLNRIVAQGLPKALDFKSDRFRQDVLTFVGSMHLGGFQYRYAPSVTKPTLYASVYACLLLDLFGQLGSLSDAERGSWANYFDGFQSPTDGLFRDPAVVNARYEAGDWWGARHLVLHIIAAYAALGHTPRFRFAFLDPFKDTDRLRAWLDQEQWNGEFSYASDVDNKIMNIACTLQFERDFRADGDAGKAVEYLQSYLMKKRSAKTGLWGAMNIDDPISLSRGIQFAYHLIPIYLYDRYPIDGHAQVVDNILRSQNALGGYGVALNSSACEDIDSLYLLCQLSRDTDRRTADVRLSVMRALVWMLANQNPDGGFVFRRNMPMTYGHHLMSSGKNESALFPTWFRALAIAQAARYLDIGEFRFVRCPGYQFFE